MLRFYRKPALSDSAVKQIRFKTEENLKVKIDEITTEWCFYVETNEMLNNQELATLKWLLAETFESENLSVGSFV